MDLMNTLLPIGALFQNLSFIVSKKNLTLSIKPSEKIGIVGRNGSGKSTLAKILVGFYDQYDGDIHFGGLDFKKIQRQKFREKVFSSFLASSLPEVERQFKPKEDLNVKILEKYNKAYEKYSGTQQTKFI